MDCLGESNYRQCSESPCSVPGDGEKAKEMDGIPREVKQHEAAAKICAWPQPESTLTLYFHLKKDRQNLHGLK